MMTYLYSALSSFRCVFSRQVPWMLFCLVVLGLIGCEHLIGVSSLCRFWGLEESGYHALLHFFRSHAWSLSGLVLQWGSFVLCQNVVVKTGERVVVFGDHTLVAKDGRRMPAVVTLHQESETQTKPSYFRGHCWGAIGLLIGSVRAAFCLPIDLRIHQGHTHLAQTDAKEPMGDRLVQMAIEFSLNHDLAGVLILDAFFPSAAVFNLAASVWSITLKQPLLTLIIRAKSNCVAYCEPMHSERRRPGRPRKYGEKVHLMELFDHTHCFSKATCRVYGRVEQISIMAVNLLWEPTDSLIRFVLARTSRGPIILMCSDLSQDPVLALELYCSRVRIEIMFDMLKNLIFAFSYRFWSKHLPRHSRKPKKNSNLEASSPQSLPTVKECWDAYERFVMLGAISLGLLQLIAIKFTHSVWSHHEAFMRTRSRGIPSERTVKSVIATLLLKDLHSLAPHAMLRKTQRRFGSKQPLPSNHSDPVQPEACCASP
jgi:hypothetical protein